MGGYCRLDSGERSSDAGGRGRMIITFPDCTYKAKHQLSQNREVPSDSADK